MFGFFGLQSFFLTDEQIKSLGKFSVDLYQQANILLKTRGDFTFEELLNTAFLEVYNGRQLYLKYQADNERNRGKKARKRFK